MGLRTVQGCLEQAIYDITRAPTNVVGSGRTDAGVHATGQVAHFDSGTERSADQLLRALNAVLPRDVAVRVLEAIPAHFHARYSASRRTYRYRLIVAPIRCPTQRLQSWHVGPADPDAMRDAAVWLVGVHDFGALGKPARIGGSTVREVSRIDIVESGATLELVVEANAFLRHQVRRMAGLLVDVGRGRRTPADAAGLVGGEKVVPVRRAPPQGLFLETVEYPANPAEWRTRSESEDMDSGSE